MDERIQTPQTASPESAVEQEGGLSTSTQGPQLIASAGGVGNPGGNGGRGAEAMGGELGDGVLMARALPNFTPFAGLINRGGVPFNRGPRQARTPADSIEPGFEVSERVQVLEMHPGNWYKVSRTARNQTQVGFVDAARVSMMPGHIGGSTRRPGMNNEGTGIANDLTFGDMTADQIHALHPLMHLTTRVPEWSLWADLRLMCHGIFASGDLSTNIGMMIDKFQRNEGGVYQSDILNTAVQNHPSQQNFVRAARTAFWHKLVSVSGNANRLRGTELQQIARPIFNSSADTWRGGLTIAINDVWAYDVDLVDYDREGDNYSANVKLTLHDHFGLDEPDVTKVYGWGAGFRAWFVLQHLYGYKPFQVQIPLTYNFSGSLTTPP
jgi:hypothetical protein